MVSGKGYTACLISVAIFVGVRIQPPFEPAGCQAKCPKPSYGVDGKHYIEVTTQMHVLAAALVKNTEVLFFSPSQHNHVDLCGLQPFLPFGDLLMVSKSEHFLH